MGGLEVVKQQPKDEFQADWATAGDVSIPQAEVADVSCLNLLLLVADIH